MPLGLSTCGYGMICTLDEEWGDLASGSITKHSFGPRQVTSYLLGFCLGLRELILQYGPCFFRVYFVTGPVPSIITYNPHNDCIRQAAILILQIRKWRSKG